jgi:hypothetical protein
MRERKKIGQIALNLLLTIMACLSLMSPALKNGFPLLYSDSATYILYGFWQGVPIDRPILYSLFLRHISLAYSLWLPVFAQSVMVLYLVFKLFRCVFRLKNAYAIACVVLIVLAFTTGLSNFISQLMPDLFASLAFIAVVLLLYYKNLSQWDKYFLPILIVFFVACHLSNLPLVLFLLFAIALSKALFPFQQAISFSALFILMVLTIVCVPVINYLYDGNWYYSKSKHVFMSATLQRKGIMYDYLSENCQKHDFVLCRSLDKLKTQDHTAYLWTAESALLDSACLADGGWGNCWAQKNAELGVIIQNTLQEPKFLKRYLLGSIQDFWVQLFDFEIGHLTQQGKNSAFTPIISAHLPNDLGHFEKAAQYQNDLFFHSVTQIQLLLVTLSVLGLLVLSLMFIKKQQRHFLVLIALLVLFLLANAAVCGILSTPVNRYQARVIWLLPLFFIALLVLYYQNKGHNRKDLFAKP